jgi:hypothetical protein
VEDSALKRTPGNKVSLGFFIVLCVITTVTFYMDQSKNDVLMKTIQHWWLNLWSIYDIYTNVERGIATEIAFNYLSAIKSMIRFSMYEAQVWMWDVIIYPFLTRFKIYRLFHVSGRKKMYIICPCVTCSVASVIEAPTA